MTDSDLDLTSVAKELYAALDGRVSEDILLKDLNKYIVVYKTGITLAKDGILRKYSSNKPAGTVVSSAGITKKINELEGTEMNVTVVAKMIFVEKRTINSKNGEKTIVSGIMADDTGTTPFTIWEDSGSFEKGVVYTFRNAYTKKWKDQVQVNIGSRGKVEPNGEVTFQAPVQSSGGSSFGPAEDCRIGDINEQTRSLNVVGRISNVSSREVSIKGEPRTIYGGTIADSTGKIQFNSWENFDLKDGETISIKNAYITSWKGILQLNFGNKSVVERSEADIGEVSFGPSVKTVEDVMKVGGLDISITGTIVDIRTGSGLIKRCPQCNRSVLGQECTVHGMIEPVMDLRLKITIDDGTGAISAIINRKDTEKLTGITLEQATELAKEKGDMGTVANRMSSSLLLKKITVTGNVMSDEEYGPQMSVHSTEEVSTDMTAEAEKLLEEVEGSL